MLRIASDDIPDRPQPFAFRPAVESLETRYAPTAPTPLPDFYTVRSGRVLTTTNLPPFPSKNLAVPQNSKRGVLANDLDVDTSKFLVGLSATLVSGPVDVATGIAVTTPFTFNSQGNGSFRFRAPRNFNGTVQFTYQPVNGAGEIGATTAVNINVRGPIRRVAFGAGEGGGPRVDVFDSSTTNNLFNFYAYPQEFTGGVRVATADFNGDNVDDIVTVPGPGGGPVLRIFDGTNGDLLESFYVMGGQFTGGLNIATADVNGDDQDDIILGADRGGGPRVEVLDGSTLTPIASFFAYPPEFRGGVRVAAGDITGSGTSESIVTAPGFGGGPVARAFELDAANNLSMTQSFFAGDAADTRGLYVAVGDYNGDYTDDIAVGSGAGAAELRVYSGIDMTQYYSRNFGASQQLPGLAGFDPSASTPQSGLTAGLVNGPGAVPSGLPDTGVPPAPGSLTGFTGGARIATSYANRDDNADLVVATGPNAIPEITIYGGGGGASGLFSTKLANFLLYGGKFYGGIFPTGHQ